jgi:hypothetical protein
MPPVNPYSAGGMVTDPTMFFGRDDELRRIRDRLRKGASTSVVGLRRIGKSSLLYQLAHQTDSLPADVVATYLDLQDAAHHQPLGLLASALNGLDKRLDYRYRIPPVEGLADFSARVKQMAADGFRPVLCLDEAEELTDRPAFDDNFFEALRSLGNQRALTFVTASGQSLDLLLKGANRSSPFYNLFINLELAGLSDAGARVLLTDPFRRAGLPPPSSDYVNYALTLAGHYPFYLQMLAYHLFEMRAAGRRMNRDALRQAFARDSERHFRGLWNHLSPVEQEGVRRLAGLPGEVTDERIERLRRSGLVEGPAEKSRLFSDLFKQQVWEGVFESEESPRPGPIHRHLPLKEVAKASVSRPWQRWLLVGLGIVSGVALLLWLVFGLPSEPATLECAGGDYVVSLDYPRYLATGDSGRMNWNLHNYATGPITATLTIALPPAHVQIEGQSNSFTLKDLKQNGTDAGQVSFHRRPPAHWFWQPLEPITPVVELSVGDAPVECEGGTPPIQAGPVHALNSFWAWLSTTGPIGWLVLAGLEWFKTIGKKQADL